MMNDTPPKRDKDTKAERLNAALRANLQRRKIAAQAPAKGPAPKAPTEDTSEN